MQKLSVAPIFDRVARVYDTEFVQQRMVHRPINIPTPEAVTVGIRP